MTTTPSSHYQDRKVVGRPREWTEERLDTLRSAYAAGIPAAELSTVLSATPGAIRKAAERAGIRWVAPGPTHGRPSTYSALGCRCAECRAAYTKWRREWCHRKRGTAPYRHGTASGYAVHGCRCGACRDWRRAVNKRACERRKAAGR